MFAMREEEESLCLIPKNGRRLNEQLNTSILNIIIYS